MEHVVREFIFRLRRDLCKREGDKNDSFPEGFFTLGIGMIHQHFKLVDVLTAAEKCVGIEGKTVLKTP